MKTEELVILIAFAGFWIVLMVLLMWFMSTHYQRIQRRFEESIETSGTIVNIRLGDSHRDGPSSVPYVVTYSYYAGSRLYEKSFESGAKKRVHELKPNDRIVVYYDRQKPENAVTAMQIEWEKSMWWKILLGFAVIIIPTVIITIYAA